SSRSAASLDLPQDAALCRNGSAGRRFPFPIVCVHERVRMFSLEKFGVRRGDSVTAGDITLDLATPGALFIVGAGGAGKSSLLAALAGSQDVEPLGTATLDGQALPIGETAWIRQRIALEGAESVADVLRESGIPQEEARGWLQEAGVEP